MKLYIGLDDFDSPLGGCTTYIAAKLAIFLNEQSGVKFLDYPRLVRLNPNVPFKTRGNAAVSLVVDVPSRKADSLKELILGFLQNYVQYLEHKTDPVVVFYEGDVGHELRKFYWRALTELVAFSYAQKVASKIGADAVKWKKGKGLVGALAAIGVDLSIDYTFELLVYRKHVGSRRRLVDFESVIAMDRALRPLVFNNIDYKKRRLLLTPHGPDPVLLGIRGENPNVLKRALKMIRILEDADFWAIFRTNQGTGVHFAAKTIAEVRPYDSVVVSGQVVCEPEVKTGGHVFFKLSDKTGEITCAVYRETGFLRNVARLLRPGDVVRVYGGVRPPSSSHGLTLNVEAIQVVKPAFRVKTLMPKCPRCGKTLSSAGVGKGLKCKRCGFRLPIPVEKVILQPAILEPGFYQPPPSAHRHLTRPITRIGKRNREPISIIEEWYGFCR